MLMKQLQRPIIITLAIALLCIAAFIGYAYMVNRKTVEASIWARQTGKTIDRINDALLTSRELELLRDKLIETWHPDTIGDANALSEAITDSIQIAMNVGGHSGISTSQSDTIRHYLNGNTATIRQLALGNLLTADKISYHTTLLSSYLRNLHKTEHIALAAELAQWNRSTETLYQFAITAGIILSIILIMALLRINFIMHELRTTRTALGDHEELYRQLVEDSGVLTYTANREGYFEYVSPQAVALTGYHPEDLLERHYSLLITPDTYTELNIFYQEQVFRREAITTREVEMITRSGAKKWVEQQVTLRFHQDKFIGYQALVKDIHEKKTLQLRMDKLHADQEEIQHLLLSILAHTPTFVFIKDLYGRYLLVNKEFEKITGHAAADIIGRTDLEVSQPAEARKWAASDQKAIDTREPVKVVGSLERNGQLCHYLVTKYPLLDKHNEVYGIGATGVDITEHIRRENELSDARASAEEARRVQEIFLANMSHALRTPINGITGMSYLLHKTPLTDTQQEYADAIAASAEKLALLVNDILEISRIRAGKLQLEKGDLNLPLLLHKAMASISPTAEAKGLNIYCDLDEHIPTQLTGDVLRLGQVFGALLENAVKFTAVGNIELTAMLLEETEKNVRVGISVSDTGMGIPPDQLEAIFETYAHATPETALYFGGAGLGLAICKEIVHQHGGAITVRSELGEGASFYVELPLEKYSDGAAPRQALTGQSLEGKRILLAEDNPINQKVVRYTLQQTGATVEVVADGLSAMQLMMQRTYDCLLLDLQMPDMTGYETVAALRRLGFTTPAIAITASTQSEETEKALSAGFNEYIAKPFPPDELVYKILDLLKPGPVKASVEASAPPLVDFEYLHKLTENDNDYLKELLDTFNKTGPAYMDQLALSVQEQRWEDVQFEAHRLRASLSVVRIPALTRLMLELEKDAEQQSTGSAQKRLQSAQLLYEEAKAAIAAFRQAL